ncbi:MAG: DUF4843 domain-containing protein [Chitinophagaceae bacterium]
MKKYSCIIVILLAVAAGCKKADYLLYNDMARIQIADTSVLNSTFVYDAPEVSRDTIYIRLNTIGGITDQNRTVVLEQIPEFDITYVRDPITNTITDSIVKEKSFRAVPGVHYVALNDPSMLSLLVIHANKASDSLPIILLRDTSLKTNAYRLRLKVVAGKDFAIGERKMIEKTIQFSDRLERFESWKADNGTSPAFSSFGKYSVNKHQFMIDILKTKIDEDWYKAIALAQAQQHYKNMLRDALAEFNANPVNINSGKAPLHETADPTSPLVTFPN